MTELRTYDPTRRCPKCGGVPNTRHERSPVGGYDMLRIIRKCGRCDYFWRELPLDYGHSDEEAAS